MKPSKVLKRASKLVEQGWCQGAAARDKNGREVAVLSDEAVKFCAFGAICRVEGIDYGPHNWLVVDDYTSFMYLQYHIGGPIGPWNDQATNTQLNVQRTLRKLARELKETG